MKPQITIRLDPDDMERIKALAQKDNRPVSNYISWIIVQHLSLETFLGGMPINLLICCGKLVYNVCTF